MQKPYATLNKYPAFVQLNGKKFQFSYQAANAQDAVYVFADSSTTVEYISLSLEAALNNRLYLRYCSTFTGDVVFAKNKNKILVGLRDLVDQTFYKKEQEVVSLLAYSEEDPLTYAFGLSCEPPSMEEVQLIDSLSRRPTTINKIILDAEKSEQSLIWAANQAMMAKGIFSYVEDLIYYQGDEINQKWLMNLHLAA